jgi:hypothetical protein
MASAETNVRNAVIDIVENEFSSEGWTVAHDKLGRSAGKDGDAFACSPERSGENPRNVLMLEVDVLLQVYLKFEPVPDENIAVDPTAIESAADRLRTAFQDESGGTGSDMWFLRLRRIEFPDDPTGNKTRLEAHITGWANNDAGIPG